MPSISRQIRSADTLLECLDAVRHGRALAALSCGLIAAGLLMGLAGQAAYREAAFLAACCGLLALSTAFYALNLAGVLLMDDARQRRQGPWTGTLRLALRSTSRLLGVMFLLAVTYAAGALFLALVLVICKMPWLGPVLYAVVMPMAVLVVGVALLALPTVVLPLAAPAVWDGADAVQCIGRLFAIARARLLSVVIMMLLVTLLATAVGAVALSVVSAGGSVVAGMSMAILGIDLSMGPLAGNGRWDVGSSSHLGPGLVGGVAVAAVALVMPALVYLRGACAVYLAQEDVVQAREDELYGPPSGHVQGATASDTATTPGMLMMPSAKAAGIAAAPATALDSHEGEFSGVDVDLPLDEGPADAVCLALRCPSCGGLVLGDDRFCGHCGAALSARA